MNGVIIWFRRDLRLHDNPALIWAAQQGHPIIALYIDSAEEEGEWVTGAASRWWLQQSLDTLSQQLAEEGIRLHFFRGRAADVLLQVVRETAIMNVGCTRLSEPHLQARDRKSKEQLAEAGVTLHIFDEWHLLQPDSLLNQQGKPYKVFTPFWKRLRRELTGFPVAETGSQSTPHFLKPSPRQPSGGGSLAELALCDLHPWQQKLAVHWQPGERFAWQRLELFLGGMLGDYPVSRDRPAVDGTSMLSPHLHFGEITARQILRELMPLLDHSATSAAAEAWLRQLGWAEFARYVLWHFPYTTDQPMDPRFGNNFWQMDEVKFTAWKKGETGVAIIDAGMRQLWQSGWMHNRVRMLVASFLTKNLGLPWQAGASWFWETLVDADLANNSM
ncbi:MAG: DNA photolyase family protein, partial [Gammaproteobacteria bacterium]|nr:DNA photolyase family protein [Gammaproteobacteria bacterium]